MSILDRPEKVALTREQIIERGREARQLLGSAVLGEAFEEAERSFFEQWLGSDKPEIREAAWAKVHAVHEVQRVLRSIMAHGEYTESAVRKAQ